MPIQVEFYPVDWHDISFAIKEANDWICALCNQQCRRPGEPFDTHRRTLTCAHWFHEYMTPTTFVVPLCSPCHNKHDAYYRQYRRERSRDHKQRRAGQLPLFALAPFQDHPYERRDPSGIPSG